MPFLFTAWTMAKRKDREPWADVFAKVRVWKSGLSVYPPRPAPAQLDETEEQLGCRLPASYRAFAERFGLQGELVGWVRLDPLMGKKGDFFTVVGRTRMWRMEFAEYPDNARRVGEDFAAHLVAFASNGGGDSFAFHTGEVTDRKRSEYKVYELGRLGGWKEHHGDSFAEFAVNMDRLVRSWREAEPERNDPPGVIMHYPSPAQRRPFTKKAIADWLAANGHTVRDLGRAIQTGRTDAFPVLADALEEAGCTNRDVLDSCRHGDPDIDGAWVLRVLLGDDAKPK